MSASSRRSEAIWIESKSYWQIKTQRDGVRKAFYSSLPGRKGKHDAENKADEWMKTGTSEMKFSAGWAEYVKYMKETTGSSNVAKIECEGRNYLKPIVGEKRLSLITPHDWQKCVNLPASKGLSRRTCLNVQRTIATFINFARRNRWKIERPEPRDIKTPKNAPVGVRHVLQPAALQTLFCKDEFMLRGKMQPVFEIHALRFMTLTGLRRGELCGLKNTDISGRKLHIKRSVNIFGEETPGKTINAQRSIVLSARAFDTLDDQRMMLDRRGIKSPWVFPDEYGERMAPDHLYRRWVKYRDENGINSNLHELRHTFISIIKNDMPAPMVKAIVGHADSMDTFGVYGHEIDGDLEQAANIVDAAFDRVLNGLQSGLRGNEKSPEIQ